MKLIIVTSLIILISTSNSFAEVSDNSLNFDYQCLMCKWSAQLIITYHNEGASPNRLFNLLSVFCKYLGKLDSVSKLKKGIICNG